MEMIYNIEVQDSRTGNWRPRAQRPGTSANDALRNYGLQGSRPRLGHAWSKSGKYFRALNSGDIA